MRKVLVIIFCLSLLVTGATSFVDNNHDTSKNKKSISTLLAKEVKVEGYYRKDGTYVRPHIKHYTGTTTKRSSSARYKFMKQTGYSKGRPGYIVDHIIPLACGGSDDPSNMQWQTKAEAKAKDKWERKECK